MHIVLLLAFVCHQHTSIWKTVLQNRPGGIGLLNSLASGRFRGFLEKKNT